MRTPIDTKKKLKEYIIRDSSCLKWEDLSFKDRVIKKITKDTQYYILLYLKYARIDEYLEYTAKGKIDQIKWIFNRRRKNKLGQFLDIDLYSESFGTALSVFHGGIIVHPSVRFGDNCKLHGHNCIGNNGKTAEVPRAGNGIDVGIGACIIGDIELSDNIIIGANAVVNKSIEKSNSVHVGIPASMKKSYITLES